MLSYNVASLRLKVVLLQAGQVVSFVVRPIPDLDAMPDRNLWDGFRSASFNAILESDRVIQHANVSQE